MIRSRFFARSTMLALCVLSTSAAGPCADDAKRDLSVSPSDNAAIAAAAATGTLVPNDSDVRAVDYKLASDRFRDWSRAQRSLDALPAGGETNILRVRSASNDTVDQMVRRLEADAAARRAIEPSGLSVREYVLTSLALAQAMAASENGARARLIGVPSENLDVYSRNRDDYRRFRRDSRLRVVDDRDSDSDSDGKGDNKADSDGNRKADSDGDSDRKDSDKGGGKKGKAKGRARTNELTAWGWKALSSLRGGALYLTAARLDSSSPPWRRSVNIAVQIEPAAGAPPAVEYRWDTDTDILTARLAGTATTSGMSGSVGLEGTDGSWLIFDVAAGRINGIEVAVWPDVHKRPALTPPSTIEDACVVIPSRASQPGIASLEVDTLIMAEADQGKKVIHFRVGARREARTVRLGQDLLLDVDSQSRVAGLWMLNVPPFPSTSRAP